MKSILATIKVQKLLEWGYSTLPKGLFASQSVINERYRCLYGQKEWQKFLHRSHLNTTKAYIILGLLALGILVIFLFSQWNGTAVIQELKRPTYEEGTKEERLIATIIRNNETYRKGITLRVEPVSLTLEEKKQQLSRIKEQLPDMIKKDNDDLNHISSDLALPTQLDGGTITVQWQSSRPELINEKGDLDAFATRNGGSATLIAVLTYDPVSITTTLPITFLPGQKQDYQESMDKRLENVAEAVATELKNQDVDLVIPLPDRTEDGLPIVWEQSGDTKPTIMILLPFLLGLLYVYNRRYDAIKREVMLVNQTILEDFPELVEKLVLLLSAGLVTETALKRIVYDYARSRNPKDRRFLYEGLLAMEQRISETNTTLIPELKRLAVESGLRELTRFATIVEDNIHKGSTLLEKLEGEVGLLWSARKKGAEEKGRLAETRLNFPLLILLLTLVMITTSPVLLTI